MKKKLSSTALLFLGVGIFGIVWAIIWVLSGWGATKHPPMVADDTFEFQLGRGSGWHGLDLVKIGADGQAVYEYQYGAGKWKRKTFSVDAQRLQALIDKINALHIFDLEREYHANIADGTQWCLLIKVKGETKAVYCNNAFPQAITDLAAFVDLTILQPWAEPVDPVTVPRSQYRQHEQEIWESIR